LFFDFYEHDFIENIKDEYKTTTPTRKSLNEGILLRFRFNSTQKKNNTFVHDLLISGNSKGAWGSWVFILNGIKTHSHVRYWFLF